MPKAIVDPKEIRRFAAVLGNAAESMKNKKAAVAVSFSSLKQVWRDDKYAQFDRVFSETSAQLSQFLKQAEAYSEYLKKKAEKIDVYTGGRY